MSDWFLFDDVEKFAPGALGQPGRRTFFIQVQADGRTVSVKCEKLHVASLAKAFLDLLTDLPSDGGRAENAARPTEPVNPRWSLGAIGLGYEPDHDRIIVTLQEATEATAEEDPATSEAGQIRLHLTRDQAAAFANLGNRLVASGRPTCVLCHSPIDPEGVTCVCWN